MSTSTLSEAGTYTIQVQGTLSASGDSKTITFDIVLTDPCSVSAITSYKPTDKTYTIGGAAQTFSFTAWSLNAVCGSFTYASTQTVPTVGSLPAFLTNPYLTDSKQYNLYSTDISISSATYTIKITGTVGSLSKEETFDIVVTNPCTVSAITSNKPADKTYTIGDAAQTFSFTDWTITDSVCGTFSYVST